MVQGSSRHPSDQGWSHSLRDDDCWTSSSSDTDDDPSAATSRTMKAVSGKASSSTAGEEDWANLWSDKSDPVDIGMIEEPEDLKFVDTPFTIARRNGRTLPSKENARERSGKKQAVSSAAKQGPGKQTESLSNESVSKRPPPSASKKRPPPFPASSPFPSPSRARPATQPSQPIIPSTSALRSTHASATPTTKAPRSSFSRPSFSSSQAFAAMPRRPPPPASSPKTPSQTSQNTQFDVDARGREANEVIILSDDDDDEPALESSLDNKTDTSDTTPTSPFRPPEAKKSPVEIEIRSDSSTPPPPPPPQLSPQQQQKVPINPAPRPATKSTKPFVSPFRRPPPSSQKPYTSTVDRNGESFGEPVERLSQPRQSLPSLDNPHLPQPSSSRPPPLIAKQSSYSSPHGAQRFVTASASGQLSTAAAVEAFPRSEALQRTQPSTPASSHYHPPTSGTRLDRFRHRPSAAEAQPDAVHPLPANPFPPSRASTSRPDPLPQSSHLAPPVGPTSPSSHLEAIPPPPASGKFTLPGLTPSVVKPKKGFQPAEPLSAFRARIGVEDKVSTTGKRDVSATAEAEKGGDREKVVLGAAVRSVRPVAFSSPSTSTTSTGRSSLSVAGALRKKPRLGVNPLVTARRTEGNEEQDKDSAEAKLRAVYRSLD